MVETVPGPVEGLYKAGRSLIGALVLLGGLLVGLTSSTWVDAASLIRLSAVL